MFCIWHFKHIFSYILFVCITISLIINIYHLLTHVTIKSGFAPHSRASPQSNNNNLFIYKLKYIEDEFYLILTLNEPTLSFVLMLSILQARIVALFSVKKIMLLIKRELRQHELLISLLNKTVCIPGTKIPYIIIIYIYI